MDVNFFCNQSLSVLHNTLFKYYIIHCLLFSFPIGAQGAPFLLVINKEKHSKIGYEDATEVDMHCTHVYSDTFLLLYTCC